MRIAFDKDKNHVVFLHENVEEYEKLAWFPGFAKISVYNTCPAVVPVAFSLVSRLSAFLKLKIDKDVKEWLDAEWKLRALPENFKFHTTPKVYQEIALRYMYSVGSGGLLLDPGMGKSKVVLDYIFLMGFKKVIVVCPKALLFVWEDEIQIHRPELSFYTVKSTNWESEKDGISKAQVTIINYTKAVTLGGFLKREGFEFMHIDEFLIKDPKTARTTALTELSKHIPYRCGGSGTLVNNTPMDMFAPVRYLQPALVGGNYQKFASKYTVTSETKKPGQDKKIKFVVGYKNVAEARSILDSCCIVMTKSQWLSLPEKRFKDSLSPMQGFQKEVYDTLRSNYIAEIPGHGYVEVDNPLVMMSKLYQISNGFLYMEDSPEELSLIGLPEGSGTEEGSEEEAPKPKRTKSRKTFFFKENPKAAAFKETLKSLPTRRGIIWYNMSAELTIIENILSEIGAKWDVIKGGEKRTGEKVRAFNKSQDTQWLVCQAKSVNYGITVLGSKKSEEESLESLESVDPDKFVPELDSKVYTEVFYSVNFSLEVYLQQQDRIHRIGQENTCDYFRFFTTSAIERKLREALDEKMVIRQDMLIDIAHKLRSNTDESLV